MVPPDVSGDHRSVTAKGSASASRPSGAAGGNGTSWRGDVLAAEGDLSDPSLVPVSCINATPNTTRTRITTAAVTTAAVGMRRPLVDPGSSRVRVGGRSITALSPGEFLPGTHP